MFSPYNLYLPESLFLKVPSFKILINLNIQSKRDKDKKTLESSGDKLLKKGWGENIR